MTAAGQIAASVRPSTPHPPRVSVVIAVSATDAPIAVLCDAYARPLLAAGYEFEFVVVLDGVRGSVERELHALAERHPLKIVRLQGGGLGESIALSAGVERAQGEFIVNAPQYLQAEPGDLVKVVQTLEQGADCVATWRSPRVDPWLNRTQSRVFNWCLRLLMGMKFHDLNSSLRGMRRQVLEEVNVYGDLYRFLPVLALRQGFKVVEIKVRHREERGRSGFYGVGVYARRALDILAITFLTRFTQKPLRFFGMLGFASILIGVGLSIAPLYSKYITGDKGLSTSIMFMLSLLSAAFGIQLFGFGLVGEIIIFTQSRNLRDYRIEDETEVVPEGANMRLEHEPPATPAWTTAPAVRELLPGEDARWDGYVRRHAQGTFFHQTGWRKVVEDTFRHAPHYLVVEEGRRLSGVLPLFWIKSPFLGKQLISTPYAVYGGLLADGETQERLLLESAKALGKQLGAGYLEMRHLEPHSALANGEHGERSDLYVTFRKLLPDDPDAILPAIPKKARAEVRRARDKFGMTFRESDDVTRLHELFAINKRRLGSPSLPRRWFHALREEFGKHVVVHEVCAPSGAVVAAVMSFLHRDTFYAYYSGSDDEHHRTGMMDFMYCKMMEWATQRGCRVFDFGRSRKESGAAAFKHNMGFESQPLAYDYALLDEKAGLPGFHPSNPRLALPRRLWARLPLFLTARLGGRLSRYLP